MTWRCSIENDSIGFSVAIALANVYENGGQMLRFAPVAVTDYRPGEAIPETARLELPRGAAIALMLELQNVLAPDRRSVDREVLERTDEALAIERARVDRILARVDRSGAGV